MTRSSVTRKQKSGRADPKTNPPERLHLCTLRGRLAIMDIKITSSSGDDDFFAELRRQAIADAEEDCAEALANQARAEGKTNVDHHEIDARVNSSELKLDAERIRRLANGKLSGAN